LAFTIALGLGTMIPASLILEGHGGRWAGACALTFGWLLVVVLVAIFTWQLIFALRFARGRFNESLQTIFADTPVATGTPPVVPPKEEPATLSPLLPYQQPPPTAPQGYGYGSYNPPPGFVLVPASAAAGLPAPNPAQHEQEQYAQPPLQPYQPQHAYQPAPEPMVQAWSPTNGPVNRPMEVSGHLPGWRAP
jgi:hypothetical protein